MVGFPKSPLAVIRLFSGKPASIPTSFVFGNLEFFAMPSTRFAIAAYVSSAIDCNLLLPEGVNVVINDFVFPGNACQYCLLVNIGAQPFAVLYALVPVLIAVLQFPARVSTDAPGAKLIKFNPVIGTSFQE